MNDFLEAMMLICFGLSWPISLIKNIKSHSAKNMSFRFTVLIILGYLAGISAKLMSGTMNYVLIIYIINLVVVCMNLVVYFVNKSYDKKRNTAEGLKPIIRIRPLFFKRRNLYVRFKVFTCEF